MKKSKLLIPLVTLAGTAAIATPAMCLTSCSGEEQAVEYFELFAGQKKNLISNITAGELQFQFSTNEEFDEEKAKLVEPVVVMTATNSYITINRCSKKSLVDKTLTVIVTYTINPEAYTYKEVEKGKKADNEKAEFDVKIHNGTWTQTIKGFAIEAQRQDQ